jgi:hypothetical protein
MFCVNCGSYETSGGPYCTRCGFRLDTVGAPLPDTSYTQGSSATPTAAFPSGASADPALARNRSAPIGASRQHRRRHGRAIGCLALLLLIAAALVAIWSLAVQPALRDLANSVLRSELARMADQVPPLPAVPASRVTGWELVLHPTDISQTLDGTFGSAVQANTTFTSGQIHLTFHILGLSSSVTATPDVQGGYLLLHNVQVTGPLSWALTGQAVQTDFNQTLALLLRRERLQATSLTINPDRLVVFFKPSGF